MECALLVCVLSSSNPAISTFATFLKSLINFFYDYLYLQQDGKVDAGINGETVHSGPYKSGAGFIGFGTSGYFAAEFDDFNLLEAS